jgi:hypothetical protein
MGLLRATALAAALSMTAATVLTPAAAQAQVFIGVSVNFAPPPLPEYEQPPIPEPGYLWIPGYWAFDDDYGDYYWVPGTWAEAPEPGYLWTPAWWGWSDGVYAFHEGYWGPQVGFYGGVNYGYGYTGSGYEGGYWRDNHFFYNSRVNNISNNVNITNVYSQTVIVNTASRASFNGPGGVTARPTPQQMAAAQQPHLPPTTLQTQHIRAAAAMPSLRASANHGAPPIAAANRPAAFNGPGVVRAAQPGGAYRPSPTPAVQRQGAPGVYQGQEGQPPRPGSAAPPAYAGQYRPQNPGQPPRPGDAPPAYVGQYRQQTPGQANRPYAPPPQQQQERPASPPPRPAASHSPPPPKAAPHPDDHARPDEPKDH